MVQDQVIFNYNILVSKPLALPLANLYWGVGRYRVPTIVTVDILILNAASTSLYTLHYSCQAVGVHVFSFFFQISSARSTAWASCLVLWCAYKPLPSRLLPIWCAACENTCDCSGWRVEVLLEVQSCNTLLAHTCGSLL